MVPNTRLQLAFKVFKGYSTDVQGFEVTHLTESAFKEVVVADEIRRQNRS
ncbi:MAG: hypothetical protein SWE60_12565 [Thermodesulfobacteriota bacterium]|nr:hypothetical protein [Thermodesulfobacteriota bacterium]